MTCAACPDCTFALTEMELETELIGGSGHYEIHVTVETTDIEAFKDDCKTIEVKPIVIEFQRWLDKGQMTHVMTTERIKGTYEKAYETAMMTAKTLQILGHDVTRVKIECGPADAGSHLIKYMESHLAFTLPTVMVDDLRQHASMMGVHMSRNAFKHDPRAKYSTYMVTIREYDIDPMVFVRHTRSVRDSFMRKRFPAPKVIVEGCVYDTNEDMDKDWIAP